jgi:fibronectin-binding autotransporter adhesin
MKAKQFRNRIALVLLGANLFAGSPFQVGATTWTGASPTASPAWSDPNNWDVLLAPGASDSVNFANTGSTNVPGLVNNVVAANTTITNLSYLAPVSFISLTTNYHTTLLNPGVTLKIDRGTYGSGLLYVGNTTDPLNYDYQYYYKMTGPGGRLVAGDVSAPLTNQGLQITATQRGFTNHMASLDLSGLDYFSLGGGYLWVGINGGEGTAPTDRPAGRLSLAKTNLIVMVGNYYDGLNFGSFRVGESRANTPILSSWLELGQDNTICTPWLKIGGARTGTGPDQGGLMYFRAGLSNPTLKLRGSDGVSRLGTMRIGDNSWSTSGSSIGCKGIVDLTGGTVDALVDLMFVGRGPGGNDTQTYGKTAGATGVFTFTAGTFDVNTLCLGYQYGNNLSTNIGTVNVLTPNAKLSAGKLVLGYDAGGNAGGGIGVLNIDGGTVEIRTYLSKNVSVANNVSSIVTLTNNGLLNLQPAGSAAPAVATVDTLNFSSGTVANGTLVLSTINVFSPATAFPVASGTVLNPAPAGAAGTLVVNGGLALSGGTVSFDMVNGGALDQINVSGQLSLSGVTALQINPLSPIAPGTYPLMSYGALSGTAANLAAAGPIADSRYTVTFDTTAPNVSMNVGGTASSLLWSGGKNGNAWDLKTTANWNSGVDQFYAFDAVAFADGGSATPAVNLVGTLVPGSVSFNASSQDYTFAGSGKLSGPGGLTLNGSATLTLLTTNDYTGGTTINAGTLVLGDDSTAQGAAGTGPIVNSAALVINPVSTQTVANVISGSGVVTKRGSGVLKLSGASTFTGALNVEAGILQAGSATALGDASLAGGMVTVSSGATVDLGGQALGTKPFTVSGAGVNSAGAIVNSGAAQALRDVQLGTETTFGGTGAWSISSSSATSTDPGLTAYQYKLTKVGANQVAVNCLRSAPWNLDLGVVDVQEGVFSLQGNLNLGSATTQPITVRTNATLDLATYASTALTKVCSFDGGSCLFARTTNSAFDGSIAIRGNVVFDIASASVLTLNTPITGSGSVIKGVGYHPAGATSTGAGSLVLNAANTFNGDLQIAAGQVVLTDSGSLSLCPNILLVGGNLIVSNRTDGTLLLAGGQTLKGSRGFVAGSVNSPANTTVATGLTNGIVTVNGTLTLRGTTVIDVNRTGTVKTNGQLVVNGTLDCGGALNLTSSGGALQAGDTFKIISATTLLNPFSGAAITWPSLSSGLYWTNRLAVDGTIAVASAEPATSPTLSYSLASGSSSLSVSWPTAYTSYVLQAQTNALGRGLTTNWSTVTTVGNQLTLPINPANGSVFLRLLKQ